MAFGQTAVASLLAVLASTAVIAAPARATVLPPTAAPYGQTYGAWAAAWWQWAVTQPVATNPVLESTGTNCGQNQSGPVWFLAGTFGAGSATRDCTVRAGKALLFPVLNLAYFAFYNDPAEQRTEEYVRSQVTDLGNATSLFATIDGRNIENISRYLEKSVLFKVANLPADNVFGLPANFLLDPCADEGYYLVVTPLVPGHHRLHFGGSYDDSSGATHNFDTTYNLTIR